MTFSRGTVLRLAVGIGLVCAGYMLGAMKVEPDPLGATFVAVVVVAIWLLLFAETKGSEERSTLAATERSVAEEVAREIDRARRSGRPLTLARYPLLGSAPTDVRLSDKHVELIQKTMRTADRVWLERHDLYLLMPESDRNSALTGLVRLRTRLPALGGIEPCIAVFPEDGVTMRSLAIALGLEDRPEYPAHAGHHEPSTDRVRDAIAVEFARPVTPAVEPTPDEFHR